MKTFLSERQRNWAKMKFTLKMLSIVVCLLVYVQSNAQPSRRDLTGLINLLSQKYSGNKALVVILDKMPKGHDKVQLQRAVSSDTSDDETDVAHLLLQHHQAKNLSPYKKGTTKSYLQLKHDKLQKKQSLLNQDKSALRSPIIKELLRISNRIQCNKKDNCQDKCSNKYKGSMKIKCNVQCEIKYDCEEEQDECDGGDCNSCADSEECPMSTKGERLVTEGTKCKRC